MLTIVIPFTILVIIEATILIATSTDIPLTALPVVIHLTPLSTVLIGRFVTPFNRSFNIMVMVVNPFLFLCLIHHDNTSVNK
jgi:hypothetical protein